ncbi:hypothetical protein [[Ruminococcus] lactaris]|uniref:hypothetical protein n=1 Tax=[Ruminococcus] lactaris TaxID=46228 RepID=UPI00241CF73F|nr:hypothetical protein [[Ruminococcus] lactaris]
MATHEELMTSLKFGESFRNALRDYYSYGFKKLGDYEKEKVQTIKNDWMRLNNILFDYLKWSDVPGKETVMFTSLDSVSMVDNPFHRLYRFCKFNHNDPMEFFNIIFALSDKMSIAGNDYQYLQERLGVDLSLEAKKRPYYRYIDFLKRHLNDNVDYRTTTSVNLLVSKNENTTRQMNILDKDVEMVKELLRLWLQTLIEVDEKKERIHDPTIEDIEKYFYKNFLSSANPTLLHKNISEVCGAYISFISENIEHEIKIEKKSSSYEILVSGNNNLTLEFSKKDLFLVEQLINKKSWIVAKNEDGVLERPALYEVLGWDFWRIIVERNYKKYIAFLKNNLDKSIYVENVEKNNLQLFVNENEYIVIPKKDEKYVQRLYKYWEFVSSHTDVNLSDVGDSLICKNGKKRNKKKRLLTGINADGEKEFLDIPISNLDEEDMVQRIIDGDGELEEYERFYLSKERAFLITQFDLLDEAISQGRGLLASQLQCFFPSSIGLFCGDNTAINCRLNQLAALGVIQKVPSSAKGKKVAENTWRLVGRTLSELILKGSESLAGSELEFENAFYSAIDFYSKYYPLGIIGSIIKGRLDRIGARDNSAFRFRHEYFMQALNDFNLIDLLYVIENNRWCEIKYRHGTAQFSSTLLCKPIEIRTSSTTGREFLIFYNPVKRSCTNLRLEFIEEIIAYDESDVLKALKRINSSEQITASTVVADIERAYAALKYMWGVSFSEKQEGNVIEPIQTKDVKITIAYDEKNEYYIKNRLLRESRSNTEQIGVSVHPEKGLITFGARVSDPQEMRPWMRSLYSRIRNVEGIETENFSLLEDIEKCINGMEVLKEEKILPPNRWTGKSATVGRISNGELVREHEAIFNEIFGVYYYIIAEVILCCCSNSDSNKLSNEKINNIVKKVRRWYSSRGGNQTSRLSLDEITWLFENDAFGKKSKANGKEQIEFKYQCDPDTEFYKDVLPLTTLEIRWIKTILSDERIVCFFSERQLDFIKVYMNTEYPEITPFPVNNLVNFDKHIPIDSMEKLAEQSLITTLIKAINQKMLVDITYVTRYGKEIVGEFKPIVIEFSKRNNKFQAQMQSCENNRFYSINLSQIISLTIVPDEFEYFETLQNYEKHRELNERSVDIQFYDVRNTADRILTEFSPWKKYCEYDRETKIYTLHLFYQKDEELDLVVRLMGYGGNIHFVNKEHSIAREILRRYEKQRSIILEREMSTERGE